MGCYAAGLQVGDELGVGGDVGYEVIEGGGAVGEGAAGGEGLEGFEGVGDEGAVGEGFREGSRWVGCWFGGEGGGWAEEAERGGGFHDGGAGDRCGRYGDVNWVV